MTEGMKQVRIRFKKGGTVEFDPTGFTGSACQAATAPYEQALGKAISMETKPEMFQTVSEEPEVGA